MIKNTYLSVVCLLTFCMAAGTSFGSMTVDITDFGVKPSDGKDCVPAVRSALKEFSKSGSKKLIFPKGRYDFWPDLAYDKYFFISNNDEGLKRIAFPVLEMENIEIDGQGSEFVFHGFVNPFIIEKSKNVVLRDFSIDFSRTFHSEARIIAQNDKSLDVEFSEKFPYEIHSGVLTFTSGKPDREPATSTTSRNVVYPYGGLLEFDPEKRETAFMARDYWIKDAVAVERLEGRKVRILMPDLKGKPGNILVFGPKRRDIPGIAISDSENVKLFGVNIYHCGGMGVIAQRSADILLDHVNVTPAPGSGRIISITADATHYVNCTGSIEMRNCLFENQKDDPCNIHGIYAKVFECPDRTTAIVQLVHPQQFGFDFIFPETRLEFVHGPSMITFGEGVVKSVERLNKEFTRVVFASDLPVDFKAGDVVASIRNYPDVHIHDCTMRGNRARGILVNSRGKTIIENNYFHTPGAAILFEGDGRFWFEQSGVRDVIIRRNVFDNCNYGVWGNACIQVGSGIEKESRAESRYHRNIVIEKNIFKIFDPRLIHAYSVDGLVFRENRIEKSVAYPPQNQDKGFFDITSCDNVKIDDPEIIESKLKTGESFSWSNPIMFEGRGESAGQSEVRDPCIIKDRDRYYLVYTVYPFRNREEQYINEPAQGGSPGIKLFSSSDLLNWKFESWLVKSDDLPEDCPYKNRFWAPEIHKINGKFYLIFTADNWLKNEYNPAGRWGTAGYAFVGVSDKVTGPYRNITYIDGAACDTSLFGDDDGRTYAVIPRHNIDIQEIDLTGIDKGKVKLLGEPKCIIKCESDDIDLNINPDYLEGPWMTKVNGKYYLYYAELFKQPEYEYWSGVACSDNPMGTWNKDKRGKVFWGGHLAIFDGPNNRKWMSYRGEKINETRGFLCIDPAETGEAGIPLSREPSHKQVSSDW